MVDIGVIMVIGVPLGIIVPSTSQTGDQIAGPVFVCSFGPVRIGVDIDPVFRICLGLR